METKLPGLTITCYINYLPTYIGTYKLGMKVGRGKDAGSNLI